MKMTSIFVLLFPILCFSQTITYLDNPKGVDEIQERNLIITDSMSYWERNTNDEELLSKTLFTKSKSKDSLQLKYKNGFLGSRFYVEDEIKLQWMLEKQPSKDSILGYACRIAKTEFRGRVYIAHYTPDIPISDGPWKFYGLPGLILKVYSTDEKVQFEAKSIDFKQTKTKYGRLYQHFLTEKFIPFDEYKSIFMAKMEDYMKELSSKEKESESESKTDFVYDKIDMIFVGQF